MIQLGERELRQLMSMPPCVVAIVDIADAKRRNLHLGHDRVDEDIAALGEICAVASLPSGAALRVAGDKWLVASPELGGTHLSALVEAFALRESVTIHCDSSATHGDEPATVVRRTHQATIRRALRCVFARVEELPALGPAVDAIVEAIHAAPIDTPVTLDDIDRRRSDNAGWRCLEIEPPHDSCPRCGGTQFRWTGGATDVSEGVCRTCASAVEFRWA